MMSFLNKFNSIIFKIVQIMDKLNKFSNQMEGSGLSSDYSKEETKRKGKQKKQKSKNINRPFVGEGGENQLFSIRWIRSWFKPLWGESFKTKYEIFWVWRLFCVCY